MPSDCDEYAYVAVQNLASQTVHLKIETHNPAGSIKYKTALSLIGAAENAGTLADASTLIESSSGNLGVALTVICSRRGLPFTCVIDPNILPQNKKIMAALGCNLISVTARDANGGYLGARISYIRQRIAKDPSVVWLNQYENPANPAAHYRWTAPAIHRAFPGVTHVYIGAGTTGTLMGCGRYFREHCPTVKVIGVDSIGSITFGGASGPRHIPGLGTSNRPAIFDPALTSETRVVAERDAIKFCRWLARTHGYLAGGSTGSVLAAIDADWPHISRDDVIVAISPDGGERYLDTIYDDAWVADHFGDSSMAADGSSFEKKRAAR